MSNVAIVTDSTAYISKELLERLNVEVVPLYVNFPDEVIVDGSIDNVTFFEKMKNSSQMPFTSQPSPGDFVSVYERLLQEGKEIVSIHISSGISGTVESAQSAARILDENKISIVDSQSTAAGLAMLVLEATASAEKGETREAIVNLMEDLKKTQQVLFIPDTLEYLKKGGRIGGAQALLGTMLQIKPILHFSQGKIEVFDKVRTMKKAMERMVAELPGSAEGLQIALMEAEAETNAHKLEKMVQEKMPGVQVHRYELSPVITTHAGPGVVGLAFIQKDLY